MSKRNVAYIKPQDPSFLRKIKEQIGYKEGPTVDTKRQKIENLSDNDEGASDDGNSYREVEDEKPQVVVLKTGDLTAEEADAEKKRIEKEQAEKPADLSERVIFKGKVKSVNKESVPNSSSTTATAAVAESSKKDSKSKSRKVKDQKIKLSFNDEEEDDEE